MTRETSLRKKPSNSRMNPPRKSRGIHDLLLPLATTEMHSATNHKNKASFRITIADYIAANTPQRYVSASQQCLFRIKQQIFGWRALTALAKRANHQ
jgi:hypothetical protein